MDFDKIMDNYDMKGEREERKIFFFRRRGQD